MTFPRSCTVHINQHTPGKWEYMPPTHITRTTARAEVLCPCGNTLVVVANETPAETECKCGLLYVAFVGVQVLEKDDDTK